MINAIFFLPLTKYLSKVYNILLMQQQQKECKTPVLLVCVYNKLGNIITHDLYYQFFSEYGEVLRVLIFQKAKVWKTFVQMDSIKNAQRAYKKLNNRTILSDGSKMNIFPSNLKQINFQNSNLGGVDYSQLKKNGDIIQTQPYEIYEEQEQPFNRKKSQTHWMQQIFQDNKPKSFLSDIQSTYSPFKSELSWNSNTVVGNFREQNFQSPPQIRKRQESWNNCWNNWCDVDAQFRQLALESQQYRELVESSVRPKSKTIIPINPNLQQFLFQNNPSKVLFLRSIPTYHTIKSIYNIFINFGNIKKIINIKHKESMLIQYEHISDACQSKDFLNCIKNGIKIFYSHYQNLNNRKLIDQQEMEQYNISMSKKENFNPPSQILHVTYVNPEMQQQFFEKCKQYGKIVKYSWQRLQNINKWMLLLKMENIQGALKVMGFLQGIKIGNKNAKISFTRSKLQS